MATANPQQLVSDFQRALTTRDRGGANWAAGRLIDLKAGLGASWRMVATVLMHNGELDFANRAIDLFVEQAGDPAARLAQSGIRAQSGRLGEALSVLELLTPAAKNSLGYHYSRGTVLSNLGRDDEARGSLRSALELAPDSGQTMLVLAMAGKISAEDAVVIRQAAARMQAAPDHERGPYHYALGKLEHDIGQHGAAFDAFGEGAASGRRLQPYDSTVDARGADAAMAGWTSDAIAALGGDGKKPRSIFVTGLPRSGTTLVEQMLAAHPAVAGGEELSLLRLLAQDVGGVDRASVERYARANGGLAGLAELYSHLVDQRFPGDGLVVDKSLDSSRYIGLIATALGGAPIIWMRRDPIDCAFSAYRTWFLRGVEWGWSLPDIAAHFRLEDRLHDFWAKLLPDRILTVEYRDLIDDPDAQARRIADHAGIEFDAAMLHPEKVERAVVTSSAQQVREPINRKGLDVAGPYAERMRPFTDAYRG